MNVICIICSDKLGQNDDIFYTRCGHVFHYQCLTQWIERSKTCPQCREKVTQNRIHRLYFTYSDNNIVEEDTGSLRERNDSLKFQILMKENDIKYFTAKNATLERQNAGLRKEVRKVESELNQKDAAIHALKEQTRYFKEQSVEYEHLKKEVARLKKKVEDLRDIQVLLHAPCKDVEEMIGGTRDPTTLLKYITVMKKEIMRNLSKIKQLQATVKELRDELSKTSIESDSSFLEEQTKKRQLQESLAFCESEKMALQTRVSQLEEILGISGSDVSAPNVSIDPTEDDTDRAINETAVKSVIVVSNTRKRAHETEDTKYTHETKESCTSKRSKSDKIIVSNREYSTSTSESSKVPKKSRPRQSHKHTDNTYDLKKLDSFESSSRHSTSLSPETNTKSKKGRDDVPKYKNDRTRKGDNRSSSVIDLT